MVNKMRLSKILGIKKHSLVSIVGSGGKTTFMYTLGKELRRDNRVLLSTTTKIFCPKSEEADFLVIGKEKFKNIINQKSKGIYVYGGSKIENEKLTAISQKEIEDAVKSFDYIILEADGSKCKPLKGWNNNEPVIYDETEITLGVMSLEVIGKKIDDRIIHRIEEFTKLIKGLEGDTIITDHLIKVIFSQEGLFKNSRGKKILYLNKVESEKDSVNLELLLEKIKENNAEIKLLDKVIYGSLKNKNYNYIDLFNN